MTSTDDDAAPSGQSIQMENPGAEFNEAVKPMHDAGMGDMPISKSNSISALALTLAVRYADVATVQDGALYQQYKLEGRNMENLRVEWVFWVAENMERWLIKSDERIALVALEHLGEIIGDEKGDDAEDGDAGVTPGAAQ